MPTFWIVRVGSVLTPSRMPASYVTDRNSVWMVPGTHTEDWD